MDLVSIAARYPGRVCNFLRNHYGSQRGPRRECIATLRIGCVDIRLQAAFWTVVVGSGYGVYLS